MGVESDSDARAIMEKPQKQEFKHFGMDLEFLLRRSPVWRRDCIGFCFPGDIVEKGEAAEKATD